MELKEPARRLPDDLRAEFGPVLPRAVRRGNGRPPAGGTDCLHALLSVLASGIAREMLPRCPPSYQAVQRRLRVWPAADAFLTAWRRLAERSERPHGSTGATCCSTGRRGRPKRGRGVGAVAGGSRTERDRPPSGQRRPGHAARRNRPTRRRAADAGFRLRPARKGQAGVGRVRQSVERCHNFFAQFGRIRVRLDRGRERFLGGVRWPPT